LQSHIKKITKTGENATNSYCLHLILAAHDYPEVTTDFPQLRNDNCEIVVNVCSMDSREIRITFTYALVCVSHMRKHPVRLKLMNSMWSKQIKIKT